MEWSNIFRNIFLKINRIFELKNRIWSIEVEFDLKTVEADLKYIFISFFKKGKVWSKISRNWT